MPSCPGGWLSGVIYPVLIVVTVMFGFLKASFTDAVVASLDGGVRCISRNGWRKPHHRYRSLAALLLMLGVTWGVFVAAQRYRATAQALTAHAQT